jgi:hypothetical protein
MHAALFLRRISRLNLDNALHIAHQVARCLLRLLWEALQIGMHHCIGSLDSNSGGILDSPISTASFRREAS